MKELSKELGLPDIKPMGLKQLVGAVRKIERSMGDGKIHALQKEISIAKKLRSHLAWEASSL